MLQSGGVMDDLAGTGAWTQACSAAAESKSDPMRAAVQAVDKLAC